MHNNAKRVLEEYFGYQSFREGQQEIINNILAGNDTLGIMPTGSGKSICFQIPSLCLAGTTVVISPLISLMKDQIDSLLSLDIKATFINSSLTGFEIKTRMKKISQGQYDLVYIAPERLRSNRFIQQLKRVNISLIAVDEAHCISSWGHDFRPSYRLIPKLIKELATAPIVTAFTATATKEVRADIANLLGIASDNIYITGFDRPNLNFKVVKGREKKEFIIDYLKVNQKDSGIIYAATRKEVENLSTYLQQQGFSAAGYHAGMTDQERKEKQEKFVYDQIKVIVATNAFGMGIDKSNVRYVIHHNLPKNLEEYYQEAGRAGRDGAKSECILLFSPADIRLPRYFIENSELSDEHKRLKFKKLQRMIDYCHTSSCLRSFILKYFNEQVSLEGCDNCSNCNDDRKLVDISVEAQKILSCIYRMKQRFGINMVAWVLKGSKRKKVLAQNFNELSTYGIMSNYKIAKIKELINFLIAEGYILLTNSQYPVTKLTKEAKSVLAGEEKVKYKMPAEVKRISNSGELFEKLRELRAEIAKAEGFPPYVIFHDTTLTEMANQAPDSKQDMLKIKGVGRVKYKKYGRQFLEKIQEYLAANKEDVINKKQVKSRAKNKLKEDKASHLISYNLYKEENKSIKEIAECRDLALSTIKGHLIKAARQGYAIELNAFIPDEYQDLILAKIKEIGSEKLKPLKLALPDEISYFQIKAALVEYEK